MDNNIQNNNQKDEYEVYSKSYTPSNDGYTEEKNSYLYNVTGDMVLKPQKKTRLIVLCAVLGALLCVTLVFVTSLAVSQKYESILDKRLEADAINKPSASENEAFDVKNDGHENDWFYGIEEDVGMKVSNSSDKEIVYGNIGDSNLSMADVVDLVSDSVVEITTSATLRNGLVYSSGAGSGVIVNENGIIVTNNHVVEEVTDIEVRLPNGNVYEAKLIATDSQTDLAIIKITPEEELTVAVCGSSDSVRVGEEVLAIGNPLGLLGGTVTNGIISALEREITIDNETMTLLQHNAAVSPGNSGGALFNMRGELVGIVNAKYSSNGAEGLGFAIPINTVMDVYDDLVKYGYVRGRADHGLSIIEQYPMRPGYYGYVLYIIESKYTDALVYGDRLIAIDGIMPSSAKEAYRMLDEYEIGDTVDVTVYRNGRELTVPLTVSEYTP